MSKWLHCHSKGVKHFCVRFSRVYLLVFLFDLEDEGTTFLWKDDKLLQNYTTSDSRRWEGLFIGPLWEPQLWLKASLRWKIIWVPPISVAELGLLATASSGVHLSTPPTGTRVSGPWDEVTGQDTRHTTPSVSEGGAIPPQEDQGSCGLHFLEYVAGWCALVCWKWTSMPVWNSEYVKQVDMAVNL